MTPQTLVTAFLCVVLVAGSFVAGLALVDRPAADPKAAVPPAVRPSDGPGAKAAGERKVEQVPPQAAAGQVPQQAPAARKGPNKPLTREEAQGDESCIGRRVSWVCRHILSESDHGCTRHFFEAEGPPGTFSFNNVFIAEEPDHAGRSPGERVIEDALRRAAADRHQRSQDRRRRKEPFSKEKMSQQEEEYRRRHPFTVTGTIDRYEHLILFGYGERKGVPVLKNFTITAR